MNAKRNLFLIVIAAAEAATGLGLLLLPSVPFALLLGLESATVEAIFVGRIAGAALLAIGVASWMARKDGLNHPLFGLLVGVLIYNVAVAILLVYAGTVLKMTGVMLWPTVAIHAILAVWVVCFYVAFRANSEGEIGDIRGVRAALHCTAL